MIEEAIQSDLLNWTPLTLERGDYLITPGEIERFIYFVKEGALRAFIITDEEEFTIRFGYTNSIVSAIPSYFNGEPTDLFIQAIRKTQLLRIEKTAFENYISKDMETLKEYHLILTDLVSSFLAREVDLLTQSPALRIKRLRERSPQVFQEIPHKYIASYLRMSPETFSRLLNS